MSNLRLEVTVNQIEGLVDFMERHPSLALGQFQRSKEGRCLSKRLWEECALNLNAIETGSVRNAEEWRKFYVDYKARLKKTIRIYKNSLNATGGGPPAVLKLTPLQERLYTSLGYDEGEHLPGVQHNPLSQTLTRETTPILTLDSASGSENVVVYCPLSSSSMAVVGTRDAARNRVYACGRFVACPSACASSYCRASVNICGGAGTPAVPFELAKTTPTTPADYA